MSPVDAVCAQESSQDVVVRGVAFRPGASGPRELTFSLRSFLEQVKVMVTAGPPAKLQLVSGPPLVTCHLVY